MKETVVSLEKLSWQRRFCIPGMNGEKAAWMKHRLRNLPAIAKCIKAMNRYAIHLSPPPRTPPQTKQQKRYAIHIDVDGVTWY